MRYSTPLAIFILALISPSKTTEKLEETTDENGERFDIYDLLNPSSSLECVNGLSERGSCVYLRNCPRLQAQVRHLNPGRVFQYLHEYTYPCVIRGQVCCPENRVPGWNRFPGQTARPWANSEQVWQWPEVRETTTRRITTSTKRIKTTKTTERPTRKPTTTVLPTSTWSLIPEKPVRPQNPKKPGNNRIPFNGIRGKHKNRRLLPEGNCGIDFNTRVLGGDETELDEHTWMALLRMRLPSGRTAFICGGSLISSRYVLTAAHCLDSSALPAGGVIDMVRLGEHNIDESTDCVEGGNCSSPPQDIRVENSIVHPNFTPQDPGTYNDIALLRLSRDARFNVYVQPVCLPLESIPINKYDGKKLTTVGWGKTSNEKRNNSPIKMKVDVPVVATETCAPQYRIRKVNLRDTQICAGGDDGKDSCQGDSGGPLLSQDVVGSELRWHIQGIVSTGPKECGKAGNPAIYTRVNKYIDWILDNIRE